MLIIMSAMVLAVGCASFQADDDDRPNLTRSDFSKPANRADNAKQPSARNDKPDGNSDDVKPNQDNNTTSAAPLHQETLTSTTTDVKPKTNVDQGPRIDPSLVKEFDNLPKPTIVSNVKKVKQEGRTITVNAMIGQVNGRPIFASDVLDPIDAQLAAMGSTQPRRVFIQSSLKTIQQRLVTIVFDSLFLGEAQRKLSEQEVFRVNIIMKLQREELIRKWGEGSEAKAQKTIVEKTGKTLDETLLAVRHRLLIRKYQDETIYPRISVSRRDVERYYNDNYDEFNPKPGRILRLMRTLSKRDADTLDARLKAGEAFAKVARSSKNKYQASKGGLMSEPAVGEKVFGFDDLNKAMLTLKQGEHSDRITIDNAGNKSYWWLYIEKIDEGKKKSLRDVQLQIEQQLKAGQQLRLQERYRRKLFQEGSFNPIDDMSRALIEIVLSKYAA